MLVGSLVLLVFAAEPAPESDENRLPAPPLLAPPLVAVEAPDAGQPEYPQVIRRDGQVCVVTLEADGKVAEHCRADPANRLRATEQGSSPASPGAAPAGPNAAAAKPPVVPWRVGVVGVAGAEASFTTDGPVQVSFRPRIGLGARVAITRPEAGAPLPSLALLGGYAGVLEHRLFVELRAELLIPQAVQLLMPGFTAYALGGLDALLAGGVDPYIGLGVGWDYNVFAPRAGTNAEEKPQSRGGREANWLGLAQGLGYLLIPLVVVAVAVVGVIGFICAGRVEFRYHAGTTRNAGPLGRPIPTASVLFGFGI